MIGLAFPFIHFSQLSRITDYEVNIPLPDSLYASGGLISTDTSSVNADSMFVSFIEPVPLSEEERKAYATLDSTATLEEAFRPTGFLARFIDDEDESGGRQGGRFGQRIPGDLEPGFRFNRVDEFYLGLQYEIRPTDGLRLNAEGGYSTGYKDWSYGAGISHRLFRTGNITNRTGIEYRTGTMSQYRSQLYSAVLVSIPNLLGERDYFNYFRSEEIRITSAFDLRGSDWSAVAGFASGRHRSLSQESSYDLLGRKSRIQINPGIEEGHMNTLDLRLGYRMDEQYNFGVSGLRRVQLEVEYSDGALGSDFDFTTYRADVDWSFPTFFQRRFFPNTLDVKLTAGTFSGDLPLQKMGIIDGSLGHVSPFGALKTRQGLPYMGEQFLMINAEHNFRSIPFEWLGLWGLADRNWGVILFAGAGRTWIGEARKQAILNETGYRVPETAGFHYEAGLSLNGVFGIFRIDFAQRLDESAFLVNVGVARIF